MILGFTGTRRGMTPPQYEVILAYLKDMNPEYVVHGGAIGADEEFGAMVIHEHELSISNTYTCTMEVYPASRERATRWTSFAKVHQVMLPLERNILIVARCDLLLATPETQQEVLRSGTWATIRAARRSGKSHTIVFPDGTRITANDRR
jgi:hypothetical protein